MACEHCDEMENAAWNAMEDYKSVSEDAKRLRAALKASTDALEEIAKGMHHITLSGPASRHLDCPPCIAQAALDKAGAPPKGQ